MLRSWRSKDVGAIAALYAPGARFQSQPFRDLQEPRAYAEWSFSEQDEAEVWFGEPIVNGDRATCEYWGVVSFQGRHETIAGVAVIRFDADELVGDQRDYYERGRGAARAAGGLGLDHVGRALPPRPPADCRRARASSPRACPP